MVVSHSNEASLPSLCRSFTTGDNIGNLFYPGNMLPFTRGVGSACWGEGRGEDPSPTWRTGWEGGGSCGAHCPHAQATGGKGAGRTTLSWEENSSNHISIRKWKPITLFSPFLSPNMLFLFTWTTEKKCTQIWRKTLRALTGNGLQSGSAFIIMSVK